MDDISRSEANSDRDPDSEPDGSPGNPPESGAVADDSGAGPESAGGDVSGSAGDNDAEGRPTDQSASSVGGGQVGTDANLESGDDQTEENLETLRQQVEEKYDFDKFGPDDMDRMSAEEWELSFDPDTWVTGPGLLDRVEDELKSRISRREVFAVFERLADGRILAYSDEGFVIVHPDGRIEGQGTVLEDVKPTVALCSMPEYEPPSPPEEYELPDADAVPEGTGEFGNWMIPGDGVHAVARGGRLTGRVAVFVQPLDANRASHGTVFPRRLSVSVRYCRERAPLRPIPL
jgi:hypothetical protein